MGINVSVFMQWDENYSNIDTIEEIKQSNLVKDIHFLGKVDNIKLDEKYDFIEIDKLFSSKTIAKIAERAESDYIFFIIKNFKFVPGQFCIERFVNIADSTNSGLVYSDFYEIKKGDLLQHPLIDYQLGSLRDDFDFGGAVVLRTDAIKNIISQGFEEYDFAGFYNLRLKISRSYPILHIPEYLYTVYETDTRKSGEKQFDYVDPANAQMQLEMENAATNHLKNIGAYLKPQFPYLDFKKDEFEYEASVIIPVKNRIKTIGDAINSALLQKTNFNFNIIIVDNYSNDGTTELIKSFAQKDNRVVHLIPSEKNLGIGGCWNEAIRHPLCGKFSAQLDSDDLYKDFNTLQRIVDTFYREKCAMVVGAYKLTDFNLKEISSNIIDHREWTADNGMNNALRVNGFGAPRAFYTSILKNVKIPNISYGEDYAVGLAISRTYKIGRIYDPIYLCRRWSGNSDADLSINKLNAHNFYKDKIRSFEIMARKKLNGAR